MGFSFLRLKQAKLLVHTSYIVWSTVVTGNMALLTALVTNPGVSLGWSCTRSTRTTTRLGSGKLRITGGFKLISLLVLKPLPEFSWSCIMGLTIWDLHSVSFLRWCFLNILQE